jgi:hypothetical protein
MMKLPNPMQGDAWSLYGNEHTLATRYQDRTAVII